MTKRKGSNEKYSRMQLAQYRLRAIAANLESGAGMSDETRQFLIDALNRAGRGEDANEALGVAGKRGEDERWMKQSSRGRLSRTYD